MAVAAETLAANAGAGISILDYDRAALPASSPLLENCRVAMSRRLTRAETFPPLNIDPLSPLPLADAAPGGPAVKMVYFILASRKYAHETINRNVNALQRPGALAAVGSNESNLFLLHIDAKMSAEDTEHLRARVEQRPDVYHIRKPRAVMWAGWSMVLALLDAMASLVHRRLGFEYVINLSDADLTLRTDGEIRAFFTQFPGRSIMSIVARNRDPRRYKLHENFRRNCWFECAHGSAWAVASPTGEALDGMKVIQKRKCCWSRSAPIFYTPHTLSCANQQLPGVFHGSQWVSLHRSLVYHTVLHPTAKSVTTGMEMTLLPDEAWIQTIAVNSPLRRTLIASHLRFIEWPQLHGDANKYWASLGPQFHGGPMVLNATLMEHKAFLTSAMFARKVDPSIYSDVLATWDAWFAPKLRSQKEAPRQPSIASAPIHTDPSLTSNVPQATTHEYDPLIDGAGWTAFSMDGRYTWPKEGRPPVRPPVANASESPTTANTAAAGPDAKAAEARAAGTAAHGHDHDAQRGAATSHDDAAAHAHDHDEHGHRHEEAPGIVQGIVFMWMAGVLIVGTLATAVLVGRPLFRLALVRVLAAVRGGERKAASTKAI